MIRKSRRGPTNALLTALTAFVAIGLFAGVADSRLLGNPAFLDPVLKQLISPLDRRGIDVVAGETSNVAQSRRPRVAMLSGMPEVMPVGYSMKPWMTEFVAGLTAKSAGFVVGVQSSAPDSVSKDKAKFLQEWQETPRDKRVFLSFTAKDAAVAKQVASALRKSGYATFVFINAGKKAPTFDARFAGTMFAEAGHHMVLDTRSARKSHGVWFEARATGPMTAGAGNPPPGDKPPPTSETRAGSASSADGSFETVLHDSSFSESVFRKGLREGWVVTRNSEGTIFIHITQTPEALIGMLYRVKAGPRDTWTVYDARHNTGFDKPLATLAKPDGISITPCTCR